MRFIRTLLFIPILLFVSPALLLLGIVILLMDTKEGPLRLLFADEIRRYGFSVGIERFMQNVFIPTYKHNIQSFVLGAAGFLVVTVGLRGLGVLPLEIVYVALAVEFTLLVTWAITVYFTEEEPITENDNVLVHKVDTLDPANERLVAALKDLTSHVALLESRVRITETRFDQMGQLDGSLKELGNRMQVLSSEGFLQRVSSEFEKFGLLDKSLRDLSQKMDVLVNDQLNLRVKREFERLLAELTQRTSGNGTQDPQ